LTYIIVNVIIILAQATAGATGAATETVAGDYGYALRRLNTRVLSIAEEVQSPFAALNVPRCRLRGIPYRMDAAWENTSGVLKFTSVEER
jgi:hypothetical protein